MRSVLSKLTKYNVLSFMIIIINAFVCISVINYSSYYWKFNLMLIAMMMIFIVNIIVFTLDIKKRLLTLFFYLMMFLFLISRIFIPFIKGDEWWYNYSVNANSFAVYVIAISLIAIALGSLTTERIIALFKNKGKGSKKKFVDRQSMVQIIRMLLLICMVCFYLREVDKLLFMQGRAYEEFFTAYQSRMPFFITFPAGCMPYFLCAFLALKPSKRESFLWLGLYVVSAFPMLIIGVRNPFVLNCVFAFLYYFLRDVNRKKFERKWIGKCEKLLLICIVPAMILFMGAYNYIRADKAVEISPVNLVVDFAYKQGTTYDTVLQGYLYKDDLPWKDNQIYTTGALYDEVLYNSLGKVLFDAEDIGSGNGLRQAYNGHTFSHALSYTVLGKSYIAGEGRGSSFLIETYVDGGYLLLVIFSVLLGALCTVVSICFGKSWFLSMIFLNILMGLYFTPRAGATEFLTFLVSYKFWGCVIGSVILAKIWMMFRKVKSNDKKRVCFIVNDVLALNEEEQQLVNVAEALPSDYESSFCSIGRTAVDRKSLFSLVNFTWKRNVDVLVLIGNYTESTIAVASIFTKAKFIFYDYAEEICLSDTRKKDIWRFVNSFMADVIVLNKSAEKCNAKNNFKKDFNVERIDKDKDVLNQWQNFFGELCNE